MLHANVPGFWRRRFLKALAIYWHDGHLGHVIFIKFMFPLPKEAHIKFRFDWQSGLRKKDV